ncbi:MAG: response regulator [Paracoccaceae bacterium]
MTEPEAGPFPGGPVLALADDDPAFRRLVRRIAEPIGWEVREFANGAELLDGLDKGRAPWLIILDILMPDKDGIETVQSLVERDTVYHIAIVTGGNMVFASVVQYLSEGSETKIVSVLQKPLPVQEIRDLLETVTAHYA